MSTVVYVGMDVDKKKIVVARVDDDRGGELQERVIANTPSAVKKYFAPLAGQADVLAVEIRQAEANGRFDIEVTLRHADTGWDHYADGWRVLAPDGSVLGERTLFHPHVNEQPFTRSLASVQIPEEAKIVFVQARTNKGGWGAALFTLESSRE